jgi:hypothetical protein
MPTSNDALAPMARVNQKLRNPNKRDVLICSLLVLAFCYELPLIEITSYDRFNPRLVDVMTVIALIFTRWRRNPNNKLLRIWEVMTGIFVTVAVISYVVLLPPPYGYYSLFFAFKYVETLAGLWVLTGFAWQNHHIEKMLRFFCYGMIFAGAYGLLQYFGVIGSERYLPTGMLIVKQEDIILATFGITYFHSGMMGAIGTGVATALLQRKAIALPIFGLAFSASAFLALFSGSRSGLAAMIIILAIMLSKSWKHLALGGVLLGAIAGVGVVDYVRDNSVTSQRIEDTENKNSVENRLTADYLQLFGPTLKLHGIKMLLVGGGFYAVPIADSSSSDGLKYRVAYGFHNIHFFTLEQAGLGAFIIAIYFWYQVVKRGVRARHNELGRLGLAVALVIVSIGWVGQIFYHGFGTENMVTFQLFLMIALITMVKNDNPKKLSGR